MKFKGVFEMYYEKKFKNYETAMKFISKIKDTHMCELSLINNGYLVEYKPLKIIKWNN